MFRKSLTMLFVALGLFAMPVALTGCEQDEAEPMEEVGEGFENAGDEIGEGAEEVGEGLEVE